MAYSFDADEAAVEHLADQLDQMHGYARTCRLKLSAGGKINVLLLGRYRRDQPSDLPTWQDRYGDLLDIGFKTVHGSKGLEADYVMLLNMVEGAHGFPSQIEDDPVLQIPMPAPDPFPMAEERRLFYVALTRARRQIRYQHDEALALRDRADQGRRLHGRNRHRRTSRTLPTLQAWRRDASHRPLRSIQKLQHLPAVRLETEFA